MPVESARVSELFDAAVAIGDQSERRSFLDAECRSDGALRAEVDSLLEHHDTAGDFLETPAIVRLLADEQEDEIQFGSYVVTEPLGRGGMGYVFKARHVALNRPAALKVLDQELGRDNECVERFRVEMRALAEHDHENIVKVFDGGSFNGVLFLAMELVDGIDVGRLIQYLDETDNQLLVDDACEIGRLVAVALSCLHDCGQIHRDVKPKNVMLTTDGKVKLLDLGIVRVWGEEATREQLTRGRVGTDAYMAPEQWDDAHSVTIHSDVYSLGCTLYALLCGRPPFTEVSETERYQAHLRKTPVPIDELRPDVPSKLARLVDGMLAKDPFARPKTHEVAEGLRAFASHADLSGYSFIIQELMRPTTGDRNDTEWRRHRERVRMAGESLPQTSEKPPGRVRIYVLAILLALAGVAGGGLWWARSDSPSHDPEFVIYQVGERGEVPALLSETSGSVPVGTMLKIQSSRFTGTNLHLLALAGDGKARLYSTRELEKYNWGWRIDGPLPTETLLLLRFPAQLTDSERTAFVESIESLHVAPTLDRGNQIVWTTGGWKLVTPVGARSPAHVEGTWPDTLFVLLRGVNGIQLSGRTLTLHE